MVWRLLAVKNAGDVDCDWLICGPSFALMLQTCIKQTVFFLRGNPRLEVAGAQAQRMQTERRHLRAEQLAWVCKAAMAASEMRRKAHAWHLWRQVQVRDARVCRARHVFVRLVNFRASR